jgi:hypothetical protein
VNKQDLERIEQIKQRLSNWIYGNPGAGDIEWCLAMIEKLRFPSIAPAYLGEQDCSNCIHDDSGEASPCEDCGPDFSNWLPHPDLNDQIG